MSFKNREELDAISELKLVTWQFWSYHGDESRLSINKLNNRLNPTVQHPRHASLGILNIYP